MFDVSYYYFYYYFYYKMTSESQPHLEEFKLELDHCFRHLDHTQASIEQASSFLSKPWPGLETELHIETVCDYWCRYIVRV